MRNITSVHFIVFCWWWFTFNVTTQYNHNIANVDTTAAAAIDDDNDDNALTGWNEDGLNARSHHRQTINSFPACVCVCVCECVFTTFVFSILYFRAIVIVVISELIRRILLHVECFAYVQCSPFINNTKLLSSRFVSSSHPPTNNLIYMVLTAEYSAFAVQLFSCCVIRCLYMSLVVWTEHWTCYSSLA